LRPFPTHDLLVDFGELRRRLSLMVDEARRGGDGLVDAFLLACGLNQILEDYMSDGGPTLTAVARVGRSGPAPVRGLARPIAAAARFFQGRRDSGHLRNCQQELAASVDALADDLVRSHHGSDPSDVLGPDLAARCLKRLDRLDTHVQERVIRLPSCFCSLDQDPEDFGRLIDRFVELEPDRDRHLLLIGLRTSGSYTAPLCGAYLRAAGYRSVETITVRPRWTWPTGEIERIKAAERASGLVLLSDDPPNSGDSLAAVARELEALGSSREHLMIVVPLFGEELPAALAPYQRVTLPWPQWAIQDRLVHEAIRDSMRQLLVGRTVDLRARDAERRRIKVEDIGSVRPMSLGPMTDLMSGSPSRRHQRALYRVELVDAAGRIAEQEVYVKGTGLGWMGDYSLAIAEPLQEFFPEVYGRRDGLMFRAYLPPEWSVADLKTDMPGGLSHRVAEYVFARRVALATDGDLTDRLAGEGSLWKQTSQVLLPLFGKMRLPALPVTDRVATRILHPRWPSVIDGSMALTHWFAEPATGIEGIRKVDFDERAFSNQDFVVDQLFCYDAVYDLASAAADHDARAAEREEGSAFVASLRRDYEEISGAPVGEERWLLYQMMHTLTHLRFMADLPAPAQAGASLAQMVAKFRAGQRAMSRASQRYYQARFFSDLDAPGVGPLCAIDIDGVLETDELSFPATTPAGALALRALTVHGFRPVLVTGRSLDEVRERCVAYCLAGGVAEYGALVYIHDGERVSSLAGDDAGARLEQLRDHLSPLPGIHLDPAYQAVVRAYAFDRGGRRRHLETAIVEALVPVLTRLRLRRVDGACQTDFVPDEVDMGAGLRRLQKELGGEVAADVAIAIGVADIGSFAVAARAFAPANAEPALKAVARTAKVHCLRQRSQPALLVATASAIGHRPGRCATCAQPSTDAEGRLLLTVLGAADGRKLHKLRSALSASVQLALPGVARQTAAGDPAVLALGRAAGRRLIRGEGLIGSSALLFLGNLVARFLGLLFLVAAARFLVPANYGLLAYTLVIVSFGTILITNAPAGLAGFLARNAGERSQRDRYYSNWLVVVTAMLGVSLVAIVPIAVVAGLKGWMIPAVMANLLGIAIFSTYRAAQRGLGNFGPMTVFYILANLAQLIGIIVAALLGFRDTALFVAIYGLSNLAALVVIELLAPMPLSFVLASLRSGLARRIAVFSWPLLLQTGLFAVWFGSDLILVRLFLAPALTGDYAAAKTLVTLVALPAGAIGSSMVSVIAGLSGPPFRRYLSRALVLAAAVVVPSMLVLVIFGGPIVRLIFSAKYPHAAATLPWLAVGMGAYAFYVVLETVWVGMGRPVIDAVATGAGMAATLAAGVVLVPTAGLAGAAGAFALGAVVQLVAIMAFTVWAYAQSLGAGRPLGQSASLEADAEEGGAAGA